MSDTAKVAAAEEERIEVEIVDDTPENDRGPVASEKSPEGDVDLKLPEDEAKEYSRRVQERIKEYATKAHAERRAKEALARERDEVLRVTQKLMEENRRLQQLAGSNEAVAVSQAKARAEAEIERTKRLAKEAMEAGETDKFLEAQEKLQRLVAEHERYVAYRPPAPPPQRPVAPPPPPQPRVQVPEPDETGKEWLTRNRSWFQKDDEMTGYAFGLHERLIKEGVDPSSSDYYRSIDEGMRRRFPEKFEESKPADNAEQAQPARRSTVVAPATRSPSARPARKVHLTPSQLRVAQRLNLTPEQYAAQLLKENNLG